MCTEFGYTEKKCSVCLPTENNTRIDLFSGTARNASQRPALRVRLFRGSKIFSFSAVPTAKSDRNVWCLMSRVLQLGASLDHRMPFLSGGSLDTAAQLKPLIFYNLAARALTVVEHHKSPQNATAVSSPGISSFGSRSAACVNQLRGGVPSTMTRQRPILQQLHCFTPTLSTGA